MEALQQSPDTEEQWKEDIPRSEDGLAVSEAEYWKHYYEHPDFAYEWNDGILEVKPVSNKAGFLMYKWFFKVLDHFLTEYPVGEMIALEIGFRVPLPHKTVIRKPDLAVIRDDNPSEFLPKERTYSGTFDLCVEALSDSTPEESERDTVTKKAEYRAGGVKEYYILDEKGEETAFYSRDRRGTYRQIRPKNGIIRSRVLPGFQFRVSDLYRQPPMEELMEDEVYRDFILPSYQAEKQKSVRLEKQLRQEHDRAEQEKERAEQEKERAEQEKQRAEQEKQRAEQEKQRAELFAEKLRELGISVE